MGFFKSREERILSLVAIINDKDQSRKGKALKKIGKYGPSAKSAIQSILQFINDFGSNNLNNENLIIIALDTLGKIGPDAISSLPTLEKMLASKNSSLHPQIILTIGKIAMHPHPITKSILTYLKSRDIENKVAACEALYDLNYESSKYQGIMDIMTDWVRIEISKSIYYFEKNLDIIALSILNLNPYSDATKQKALIVLLAFNNYLDELVISPFIKILEEKSYISSHTAIFNDKKLDINWACARYNAVFALGIIGPFLNPLLGVAVVKTILATFRSGSIGGYDVVGIDDTRIPNVTAIGRIALAPELVVPKFIQAIEECDPGKLGESEWQYAIINALGNYHEEAEIAIPSLLRFLNNFYFSAYSEIYIQIQCLITLAKIGSKGRKSISQEWINFVVSNIEQTIDDHNNSSGEWGFTEKRIAKKAIQFFGIMQEESDPYLPILKKAEMASDIQVKKEAYKAAHLILHGEPDEDFFDSHGIHISLTASKLRCQHCNENHGTKVWPVNGDHVAFYFQKETGNYTLKVTCPYCKKDWYVVWDDNPGPIKQLSF